MSKAFILFLYGLSLYITLNAWYKKGNSGMPDPTVIAPAAWLFAVLALTADFLEGLPVVLAAAMTVVLWERTQKVPATKPAVTTKSSPHLKLAQAKSGVKR